MTFAAQIWIFILHLIVFASKFTEAGEYPRKNICQTQQCMESAMMFKKYMHNSALPCHNFYDFVCGNYLKTHPLRPGEARRSPLDTRQTYINEKISEILKNDQNTNLLSLQKAKILFQSCIDEVTIERFGEIPINLELNTIGLPLTPPFDQPWTTSFDFSRLLAKIHRYLPFTNFLFDISVTSDTRDSTKNYLQFNYTPTINHFMMEEKPKVLELFNLQAAPKLTSGVQKEKNDRKLLQNVMVKVINYMNKLTRKRRTQNSKDVLRKEVDEVVDFLIRLEKTKELETPQKYGATGMLTYTTLTELQSATDKILEGTNAQIKLNWLDYLEVLFENLRDDFRELLERDEVIVIKHMKQFTEVLKILSTVDQKVLVQSIWWLVIHSISPYATNELRNLYYDYTIRVKDLVLEPREKRCLEMAKNHFSHLFAHILIQDKENAPEIRSEVNEMISNIQLSFQESITWSKWLDSGTKMAALNKLKRVTQLISYEDWMTDADDVELIYRKVVIIPGLFYSSLRSMKITQRKKRLALLGSENTDEPISTNPIHVNASYSPDLNLIDIPVGIMGPPLYGLGLQALNYGTMGYIFAHELGHGFDNFGKEFNSYGKQKRWFKKSTKKIYEEKTKCFINSYNALYIPEAQQTVNGVLTLDENIADTLGFREALFAYRKYVATHGPEELLPGFEYYSHEKLFTMAFATLNCQVHAPAVLRDMLGKNEHSPGRARVLGVLKNSEDFAQIWACGKDRPMNPDEKCVLW